MKWREDMIPLKDSPKSRIFPVINILLIMVNLLFFLFQLSLSDAQLQNLVMHYGLRPQVFLRDLSLGNYTAAASAMLAYQFMHGGWLHIGSNMLYLWVFGDNVEDRLGHVKYLVFYLLMGFLAGLAQIVSDPGSAIPIIGASGAVAGILGAYLISCPRARVLALVPIFFLFTLAEIPAVIFLGFWFVLQLFSGLAGIGVDVSVAWWAHIGGFAAGALFIRFFGRRISCE